MLVYRQTCQKSVQAIRKKRKECKIRMDKGYIQSPIKPTHDQIYEDGLDWVESLAGKKLPEQEFEAQFSEAIWHSQSRKGDYPD